MVSPIHMMKKKDLLELQVMDQLLDLDEDFFDIHPLGGPPGLEIYNDDECPYLEPFVRFNMISYLAKLFRD